MAPVCVPAYPADQVAAPVGASDLPAVLGFWISRSGIGGWKPASSRLLRICWYKPQRRSQYLLVSAHTRTFTMTPFSL
ncbi:hypothetical protein G6F50_017745 [Rhizopus delemar]|uniref:Uncharacterized protein n=1 Tax=Rhizopus delemar TaxID=936053 RepID=A0A9P6XPK6_9FUNG|nr:hypothetical protein G6F50_017745 [Rhizopus delemar]